MYQCTDTGLQIDRQTAGKQYKQTCRFKTWICGAELVTVLSGKAETRVLKQFTDGNGTTSGGKLFHDATVAGKKLNRYASIHTFTYLTALFPGLPG